MHVGADLGTQSRAIALSTLSGTSIYRNPQLIYQQTEVLHFIDVAPVSAANSVIAGQSEMPFEEEDVAIIAAGTPHFDFSPLTLSL